MLNITHSNNKKIQVEFNKNNISDYNGLFLIDSFLEKTGFKNIFQNFSNKLNDFSNLKTYPAFDIFKYELFSSFINQRASSVANILKNEKTFRMIGITPGKSTINNFQKKSKIADTYELNTALINYVLQFHNFLYSNNGFITLDFDAVDIETHGNQEGSCKHGYYKQTMYYGLCCSIYNGTIPIFGILKPGNAGASNGVETALDMILTNIIDLHGDEVKTNILYRGDSGFGNGKNFSFCEQKGISFLARIKSNKLLKEKISQEIVENNPYKKRYKIFKYKANSWDKEKIIIAYNRPPDNISGNNEIQFYCTNIYGYEIENYDQQKIERIIELYHERGTSEHPFHDLKESFQSGWTNSTDFYTNAYKFITSIIAISIYTLFRNILFEGTNLVNSYFSIIARFIIDIPGKIVKRGRRFILRLNQDSIKSKYFYIVLTNLNKLVPT